MYCPFFLETLLPKPPVTWQPVLFILLLHRRPEINHLLLAWAGPPCLCASPDFGTKRLSCCFLMHCSHLLLTSEPLKVSLEHPCHRHVTDKPQFLPCPCPWKISASFAIQVHFLCDLLIKHHLLEDCLIHYVWMKRSKTMFMSWLGLRWICFWQTLALFIFSWLVFRCVWWDC